MTCHVTLKSAVLEHIQRRSIVHFGVYMEYTTTLPNCSLTIRLIESLPNQVLRDGVSIQLLHKYGSHVCLYIYIHMYDNCFWNLSKAAHLCLWCSCVLASNMAVFSPKHWIVHIVWVHTDSKQFLKVQVGINKQPHLRYEGYSFHLIFRPDPFQQSGSEKAGPFWDSKTLLIGLTNTLKFRNLPHSGNIIY